MFDISGRKPTNLSLRQHSTEYGIEKARLEINSQVSTLCLKKA